MQGQQWIEIYDSRVIWIFVAGILLGWYLVIFGHCIRWLLFEDKGWAVRKKVNRTLVITTFLISFLSMLRFWIEATDIFWLPPVSVDWSFAYQLILTIFETVCALRNISIQPLSHFQQDEAGWVILIIIDSVLVCSIDI
jgi:hypothetical protein